MLGTVGARRDERQVDGRRYDRREFDLRFFGRFGETLHGLLVVGKVDALFLTELAHQPLDDAMVVVVTAQMRVAVGRLHFEDAVADFQDRDVERAAAQVPDQNRFVALFLKAVRERGRRRLVDDAQHFETGDLAGVLRGLALRVVEIGGNRNDCASHAFAEIVTRVVDELLEDHRRDLLWRVILAVDFHDVAGFAHVTFDRGDGAIGIGDRLTFCKLADETLAGFGEGHDRRGRARAFRVGDDGGRRALHNGDDGVGRAEVDSDHFSHVFVPHRVFESVPDQLKSGASLRSSPGREPCTPR